MRSVLSRCLLAAAIFAAASLPPTLHGQEMDCTPPGFEPSASAPPCNFAPVVTITPFNVDVSQPNVPLTIRAEDHEIHGEPTSLLIEVDGVNVTNTWPVVLSNRQKGTDMGVWFVYNVTTNLALSDEVPVRRVRVRLCDAELLCDEQTSVIRLRKRGVEVTGDGVAATIVATTTATQTFQVKNTGTDNATFGLAATCRQTFDGQAVAPCTVSRSNATIASGDSIQVTVTFPASQPGATISVTLHANHATDPVGDAGWAEITARAYAGQTESPPQVTLVSLNAADSTVDRGRCVTISTASRGAYECGDLRVVHGLPVHRTRGRTWAPVLMYNSQHAHPRPTVYADVTVPAGIRVPETVEVAVGLTDGPTHRAHFLGSSFLPGVPQRVGVQWDGLDMPTGVYNYHVQVTSHYADSSQVAPPKPGALAVVNRSASPFGAGWWLAGWEQFVCIDCYSSPQRRLWIGGDGSTRVYTSTGGTTWTAPRPDGPPDTIRAANGLFVRKLRGGGQIEFNSLGEQVRTVNRLRQATAFTVSGNRLTGIQTPALPGMVAPGWTFGYENFGSGAWRVKTITATAPGAAPRQVTLAHGAADRRVTGITDPDGHGVVFEYASGTHARRITGQRDRRGTWVRYEYGALNKLASARLQMGAAMNLDVDPVRAFVPAEVQGVAAAAATNALSVHATQAVTRIDGPRKGPEDVTRLWLNSAGSVRRVQDPLGRQTYVQFDGDFPALPVQVISPSGMITRAAYDTLGRVDTARVVNVLGDGRDRVTTYRYDDRWEAPVSVASFEVSGATWTPLSARDTTVYDTLGNVTWTQKGTVAGRRVTFTYYDAGAGAAAGQLRSVHAPSGVPGQMARDSLLYDGRGNLRMRISPLGFHSLVVRDALGRDTLSITPVTVASGLDSTALVAGGVRVRTTYDVMDRVRHTTTIGPPAVLAGSPGGIVPATVGGDTLHVATHLDEEGLPLEVQRWASPDPALLHVLSTTYAYDAAGRKILEAGGLGAQEFRYDLAGNATAWITQRGDTITSEYDVMGRLTRRIVPEARYAWHCPSFNRPCQNPFPYHPNGPDGSLVIPEEWTWMFYDGQDNLVRAENADAIVTRDYYRNGQLRTDGLSLRGLAGTTFGDPYTVVYGYNLSGQVTSMRHPTNLAVNPGKQWDRFAYDPVTGALTDFTDRLGHYFNFRYNFAGQMTSLRGPQYSDSMRYDVEGRLSKRVEAHGTPATVLHNDTLTYDARGKLTQVQMDNGSFAHQWYSGMGMLVATDWVKGAAHQQEAYMMDALGTVVSRRSGDGGANPNDVVYRNHYLAGTGRLMEIEQQHLLPGSTGSETTERRYDESGNTEWSVLLIESDTTYRPVKVTREKRSRSYYAADQRLRYFQERDMRFATDQQSVQDEGVWEEYRYDPLGRRVLVNTRTKGLCTTGNDYRCASATTRSVWAGDQLLWEIRRASESPDEQAGTSDMYGTVSYSHALGIDRPLVITKGSRSVLTHQNWRGQFSAGTDTLGGRTDCVDGTPNCVNINWPGWRTSPWHDAKELNVATWWGGLVDGMRDASGQQYMRNRYYDPATGQFTQPDPIGIAGGLNTYGFAAGDPVTYSDPYGLKADTVPEAREATEREQANEVEVFFWGSIGRNPKSQFGHVSVAVGNRNYSLGPHGWDTQRPSATDYIARQMEVRQSGGRGLRLNLSGAQVSQLEQSLQGHSGDYNFLLNNCADPIESALEGLGFSLGALVDPANLEVNMRRIPGLVSNVTVYPHTGN